MAMESPSSETLMDLLPWQPEPPTDIPTCLRLIQGLGNRSDGCRCIGFVQSGHLAKELANRAPSCCSARGTAWDCSRQRGPCERAPREGSRGKVAQRRNGLVTHAC
ncbi:hypothetical protein SRHO_G00309950 [Serrasalmus rhombeus]